ncbi:MAG: 16S rRNA (uracil(1498)-N(3))-methyltransferase [Flavobacteriaceae bacterium]|nr:16S rRNA (uracil(1498)-N(3))-methyltransferase [Flavobacteriaceae bacterium]|tara:strand:+ start:15735 stop:16451 length:717 start_codon:yes stop_codon:yes gene_type:complete
MDLFFSSNIQKNTKNLIFSSDESRHIFKALRKRRGERIRVTNGKGLEWIGELISLNQNKTEAKKIKSTFFEKTPFKIEIAIAPTKKIDRIEWLVEKATEMGIEKIHFILTEKSERNKINIERLKKISISAIKQSQQFYLPEISELKSLELLLSEKKGIEKYIAHCHDIYPKTHLAKLPFNLKPKLLLIGPEGDFTNNEIMNAVSKGFCPISLGNNRLRTETAAIFAINILSTLFYQQK